MPWFSYGTLSSFERLVKYYTELHVDLFYSGNQEIENYFKALPRYLGSVFNLLFEKEDGSTPAMPEGAGVATINSSMRSLVNGEVFGKLMDHYPQQRRKLHDIVSQTEVFTAALYFNLERGSADSPSNSAVSARLGRAQTVATERVTPARRGSLQVAQLKQDIKPTIREYREPYEKLVERIKQNLENLDYGLSPNGWRVVALKIRKHPYLIGTSGLFALVSLGMIVDRFLKWQQRLPENVSIFDVDLPVDMVIAGGFALPLAISLVYLIGIWARMQICVGMNGSENPIDRLRRNGGDSYRETANPFHRRSTNYGSVVQTWGASSQNADYKDLPDGP